MNRKTIRVCSLLACLSVAAPVLAEEPPKAGAPAEAPAQAKPATSVPSTKPAQATGPSTIAPVTVIEPRAEGAAERSTEALPDVSALSSELSAVLDELIQARTRASVLAKTLFRTRIDINVLRRADDQQLLRLKLALDGVPVHETDGAAAVSDEAHVFTGYVAPGVHEISVDVREQAKENASFGYTRRERFRIETKKNTNTQVDVLLRDDSDMAEELPAGDQGRYEVSTRVRVTPVKVRD